MRILCILCSFFCKPKLLGKIKSINLIFFTLTLCGKKNRVDRVDSQRSFSKIIEIESKTVMHCINIVTVELEINRVQT